MSKYTTEVRYICEYYAGLDKSVGGAKVDDVIDKSLSGVFDFDFPIFDEKYRKVLEKKILKHYYTREIGLETVGLWKLKLNTKLNEIMPYYNKLYNSELLDFNPFYNINRTTKSDRNFKGNENKSETLTENIKNKGTNDYTNTTNRTGTSVEALGEKNKQTYDITDSGNNSKQSNSKDRYSDTPQGSLTNIENNAYLTNARIVDNQESGTDTNKKTGSTLDEKSGENTTNTTLVNTDTMKQAMTNDTDKTNSTVDEKIINNLDDYLENVSGKEGTETYSEMLIKYRNTFLNIDMQVISDLEELFMQIW